MDRTTTRILNESGRPIPNATDRMENRIMETQLELVEQQLEDASSSINQIDEDDRQGWTQIGGRGEQIEPTEEDLQTIRKAGRKLAKTRTGRAILRSLQKYVVGENGLRLSLGGVSEDLQMAITQKWTEWKIRNKWRKRELEIIRRVPRDGEVFLRTFQTQGMKVRFVEPEDIHDPEGEVSYGIKTSNDDVETPLAYLYAPGNSRSAEPIRAGEMLHWKGEVDMNQKRGISLLWIVRDGIEDYNNWLKRRVALNNIRTAVVLLRKHQGATPGNLSQFVNNSSDVDVNDPSGGTSRGKKLKPGTIIDTNQGTDYEFKAPNIQASDAAQDGRNILLSVAAGTGLAEWMVSGDSSEADYSSTMVSAGSAVREFKLWQGDLADFEQEFFMLHWLPYQVRHQNLPKEAAQCQARFTGMEIAMKDELKLAKANQIKRQEGVKSRRTWQEEEGLNPRREEERLNTEGHSERNRNGYEQPPEQPPEQQQPEVEGGSSAD